MLFQSDFFIFSIFTAVFVGLLFMIKLRNTKKSPDAIQKMIKELENKIINV